MADEKLKITVGTDEFIRKMNEVQKVIQETNKAMDDLYKSRPNRFNTEAVSQFNQNATALQKELADVTAEEKKLLDTQQVATKKTDEFGEAASGLGKKLGLVTLALSAITMVTRAVVQAFKDTVFGLNAMTIAGELWKTMAYNIATANFDMSKSLASAIGAGKMINEQRKKDREDMVVSSKLRTEYNKLYFESADRTQSNQKQLDKLNESLTTHNKMIDIDLTNAKENLAIVEVQLVQRPKSNKLLNEEAVLLAKIQTIEGQRYSETKRVEQRRSSLENTIREDNMKKYLAEIETRLKSQDEFQALSLKLMDEYDKAQIDMLEGDDKIRAQRDFGLKQIDEFKKQMQKLGKLSKEQEKMFAILGANIWSAFYEGLSEQGQKKLSQKDIDAISNAIAPQLAGIQKSIIRTTPGTEDKDFSIWGLLGLSPDDEEDQKMIDALQKSADKMQAVFEDILDRRVEMAQRERELLDTKISETQREIEIEAELYKEGFANNLTARKAYLEQLKVERDKALAEEEKALRQQQMAEKLIQTMNLLTSVTEILKSATKKGIVGLALAPFAIATLFAIWSKAKSSTTELAEGGSGTETGMVTGKKHSQGGERFLDHVEVERNEMWGVLNPRASHKYGDVFHEMVSSFNRDEMPQFITPIVSNNVRVDNSGSNSRLDRVIKEQEKMNIQLKQGQLYTVGNKRIIKTGNKIRIIG